ncbi:CoA transferase [Pseudonocardia aurantiaca]|uniref:CoA transferase n=1 Tax=Pseudonocardia aurantiaca TaxID=75290 RepID=A0ABW4FRG0_9PSEU
MPAAIARPPRQREVIHEVVVLPTGVDQRGDVLERGALADAMTRRTPGVTIRDDWNRPVGRVLSAVELPQGDPRLAVRTEAEWRAAAGPPPPLVERRLLGSAAPRPYRRPRVLDLTRVIAGPVATRTLAAHGADVLRIDAPGRPEIPLQAFDTLPGKRSALLDLGARRDVLAELLAGADVVIAGYRPGALDRFGLAPEDLARRHPGLVVVTLSAWGHRGPWASRRGFDSLVQAACGIAVTEGSAEQPGALPAQVLDHATGYLAAAGALLALAEQREQGGTHHVRLALAGTAAWLQGLPRAEPATVPDVDPGPYLQDLDAPAGRLTVAVPPGTVGGRPLSWPPPPPSFGTAAPDWAGG